MPQSTGAPWVQSALLQPEALGSSPRAAFPGEVTSFAPLASVRSTKLTLSWRRKRATCTRGRGTVAAVGHCTVRRCWPFGLHPAGRRAQRAALRGPGGQSRGPHAAGRKAAPSCSWRGPQERLPSDTFQDVVTESKGVDCSRSRFFSWLSSSVADPPSSQPGQRGRSHLPPASTALNVCPS